jgi:hypothetical protein
MHREKDRALLSVAAAQAAYVSKNPRVRNPPAAAAAR